MEVPQVDQLQYMLWTDFLNSAMYVEVQGSFSPLRIRVISIVAVVEEHIATVLFDSHFTTNAKDELSSLVGDIDSKYGLH